MWCMYLRLRLLLLLLHDVLLPLSQRRELVLPCYTTPPEQFGGLLCDVTLQYLFGCVGQMVAMQ